MKDYVVNNWQEYWKIFDDLIKLLEDNNQTIIAKEFKDAQRAVNGLTDGWYEFKLRFENTFNKNHETMTIEQVNTAIFLLSSLKRSLSNR